MYLIIIAWLYVTLLMALAEAFSTQGTILGAIITFVFYGLLPMSLVAYLMGTPMRRKARQREALEQAQHAQLASDASSTGEPNASRHSTGLPENATVTPMRKEP
jgi:mannose/fructose/N-acetylgalactosamine-specific phosphotransferase system component IID